MGLAMGGKTSRNAMQIVLSDGTKASAWSFKHKTIRRKKRVARTIRVERSAKGRLVSFFLNGKAVSDPVLFPGVCGSLLPPPSDPFCTPVVADGEIKTTMHKLVLGSLWGWRFSGLVHGVSVSTLGRGDAGLRRKLHAALAAQLDDDGFESLDATDGDEGVGTTSMDTTSTDTGESSDDGYADEKVESPSSGADPDTNEKADTYKQAPSPPPLPSSASSSSSPTAIPTEAPSTSLPERAQIPTEAPSTSLPERSHVDDHIGPDSRPALSDSVQGDQNQSDGGARDDASDGPSGPEAAPSVTRASPSPSHSSPYTHPPTRTPLSQSAPRASEKAGGRSHKRREDGGVSRGLSDLLASTKETSSDAAGLIMINMLSSKTRIGSYGIIFLNSCMIILTLHIKKIQWDS